MRARLGVTLVLLVSSSWACGEAQRVDPPPSGDRIFVLQLDARDQLAFAPAGPYRLEELPTRWALEDGLELALLAVSFDVLSERYPSFDVTRAASLRLVAATAGLEACAAEGLMTEGEQLIVPLDALPDGIETWTVPEGTAELAPRSAPPNLALQFEALACNRGPHPVMRPFSNSDDPAWPEALVEIGSVFAIDALDADTIIYFGSGGLARIRRHAPIRPEVDVVTFQDVFGERERSMVGGYGVVVRRGDSGTPELVNALALSSATPGQQSFAIGRFAIEDSGTFRAIAMTELVEVAAGVQWLEHLLAQADGSYLGVGGPWVVTASASSARPRLMSSVPGFNGRWVMPGPSPTLPHIVLASSRAFEGDLFQGIGSVSSLPAFAPNDVGNAVTGGFMLDDARTPMAGFDDGSLRWRRARAEWIRYPFGVPREASPCAGAAKTCGRLGISEGPYLIMPSHELGGHVLATAYCSAFFFRSTRDSCASSITKSGHELGTGVRNSLTGLTAWQGHVFVATIDRRLYELELTAD